MPRYRADERRALHGFPEPRPASGGPADAVRLLRTALAAHGVETLDGDVHETHSGRWTLSVAQGVLVWCGPVRFGWPGGTGAWTWHPLDDPEGAAELLAKHLDADPLLRLRRAYPGWTILRFAAARPPLGGRVCAIPATADLAFAPTIEGSTPLDLAAQLHAWRTHHGPRAPHPRRP